MQDLLFHSNIFIFWWEMIGIALKIKALVTIKKSDTLSSNIVFLQKKSISANIGGKL